MDLNLLTGTLSNMERQAAARALLRHGAHVDGTHLLTRKTGGLHPSYIAFNSYTSPDEKSITHEEFVEAALQDLFDAVAMQDRLDGGISLLIHCPGFVAIEALSPERMAIDLYITPRELHECPEVIGGDASCLVQAFAENYAIPHLRRFTEWCHTEGVVPPQHFPASQFRLDLEVNGHVAIPSPAIQGARAAALARSNAASSIDIFSTRDNKMRKHRHTDAFLMVPEHKSKTASNVKPMGEATSFGPPLISIGSHTDAIIDHFKMDDVVLLRLHELIGSVRSS
ncbi:hypothetical protein K503DRAFT_788246 [Rhizopogon vinicolor AM-OR11-026]|uniref:Uncharacterized protein n=1 Tax=Rhizopogon vinicolor AM-OR11-026 TaxID=1314800 RepID=A0A1B7MDU8_9AGAM|nr:hypothetical protein K503DRAFT_788246 [Rhizopogon vinicolor AM-OR11-026]